jgi:hypothetical protein
MFQRVLAGDAKGFTAWSSGPRYIVLCVAVGAALAFASGRARPPADERKGAFERVAQLVNEPLRELRPFHERITSGGGGATVLLDSRREACIGAAARVEKLGGLTFPPDANGKAVASAEEVRRAAGRFLEAVGACAPEGDAAAPGPSAVPSCVLRCMRGWSSLAGSAERLREDAAWVGVRVEPLAPAEASSSTR